LKFKELVVFTGFILPVVEFSFYSLPHVVSLRGPPSMGCVAI
jgi:hypothetical protein